MTFYYDVDINEIGICHSLSLFAIYSHKANYSAFC